MSETVLPRLDELLELRHQAHTFGLASHHLVNTTFAGMYASVFRGQGLNFEEVREYREGDDIRNMDWKVTARINEPHLKVYREERERSVVLCIDKGPHMHFGTRGTFKYIQAARAAALLGWAANKQGDRVGGMLFGDAHVGIQHYRPTKDRRALWRLLHDLSEPGNKATQGADSLEQTLKRADRGAGTGALVFVIADFNQHHSGLDRALGQLTQRHTVVLVPIDDAADKDLPAVGRVLFRAPNGHLLEIDASDPTGRERYREDWLERRRLLTATATRLGITVIPIATNQDVHRVLMEGLRRHARLRG